MEGAKWPKPHYRKTRQQAGSVMPHPRAPNEIIDKLNREIVRILVPPDVKERLIAQGADPVGDTPEQFTQYVRAGAAKWGRVIKAFNLKID